LLPERTSQKPITSLCKQRKLLRRTDGASGLNQISKKGQSNQQSEKIAAESWRRRGEKRRLKAFRGLQFVVAESDYGHKSRSKALPANTRRLVI
jgi:hypothetical protein